ncbi:VWA domain-containing protein [Aeromonas media]|nr:VWA domain-containing protein [Aeromonas media]
MAQYLAVEHNDSNDHDESGSPELLDNGVVFITATLTDGDGDSAKASVDLAGLVAFEDDGPAISVASQHGQNLLVDETVRGAGDEDTASAWATGKGTVLGYDTATAAALFVTSDTGTDGGSTAYSLTAANGAALANGTASGLFDAVSNQQIYLYVNAQGEVEGRVGSGGAADPAGALSFVIRVSGGTLEMAQYLAVEHNDSNDHDESGSPELLDNGVVFITATLTDGDGDSAKASVDLAGLVAFEDDGPAISVVSQHGQTLLVDETVRGAGDEDTASAWATGKGTVLGYDTATAAALFVTSDTGSDGGSTAYSLTAANGAALANGTASGLFDAVSNQQIYLYVNAQGEVEGRVGSGGAADPAGALSFVIRVSGGTLEMAQYLAVEHNDSNDHDESGSPELLDNGVVFITATLTDGDGDSAKASVDLAGLVAFEDDGPVISVASQHGQNLLVDETVRGAGDEDTASAWATGKGTVLGYDTATAAALFVTSDTGSDGGSTAYSLTAANGAALANGTASGLFDAVSNQQIYLYVNAQGEVEGRVGSGGAADPAGALSFVIRVSGGTLEMAQYLAVEHNDSNDHDESGSPELLDNGVVFITATLTDGDGDSAKASVDLAGLVAFEDDGPAISVVSQHGQTLLVDETVRGAGDEDTASAWATGKGTVLGYDTATAAALFVTSDTGTDGGSTAYSLTAANGAALANGTASGLFDAVSNQQIYLYVNAQGEVEGRVGSGGAADPAGALSFVIRVSGGTLEMAQYLAVEHNDSNDHDESGSPELLDNGVVFITATLTDGDGDSAKASVDLAGLVAFEDDGPVISVASQHGQNLLVDETVRGAGDEDTASAWATGKGTVLGYDTATAAALFVTSDTGTDGGSTAYSLTAANGAALANGTASGLFDAVSNQQIYLYVNAQGEVEGRVGSGGAADPAGALSFVIRVSGGTLEMAQYLAVEHNDSNDHDESGSPELLDNGVVFITATLTDGDGDSAKASVDLAGLVAFEDDGPAISVASQHGQTLLVDETVRGAGDEDTASAWATGKGTVLGYDTATAAALFVTSDTGSDGGSTAYSLTAANGAALANGTASGLFDAVSNQQIYLYVNAQGEVEGRVGSGGAADPAGALSFVIRVSGGTLEMAQYLAVEHNDSNDHDESGSPELLDNGVVFITATLTDGDGDSAKASVDLAGLVAFEDDGPAISVVSQHGQTLLVDETVRGAGDEDIASAWATGKGTVLGYDTATAAALFVTSDTGTDGGSTAYSLTAANGAALANGTASGLFDAVSNQQIYLYVNAQGEVEGRVGSGGAADPAGALSFVIRVSGGTLEMAQYLAVEHNDSNDHDESGSPELLDNGVVFITATLTDGDGDSAKASVDLAGLVGFEDDGPDIVETSKSASLANSDAGHVEGTYTVDLGSDGAGHGDLTGNISGWNGTTTTYAASMLTSDGDTIYYYVNPALPGALFAYTSTVPGAYTGGSGQDLIFTLTMDATGHYVIDMDGKVDGAIEEFSATFNKSIGGYQNYLVITDTGGIYKPGDVIPNGQNVIMTVDSLEGTVNSSTQGLATDNQWIEGANKIYFDFSNPALEVSFSVENKSNAATNLVSWTVYGTNSNGDQVTQSGSTLFTNHTEATIPTTLTNITRVELSDAGGDGFRVTGANLLERIEEDPVLTNFNVAVVDGDGDKDASTLQVTFEPVVAPVLIVGSNADDVSGSSIPFVVSGGAGEIDGKGGNDVLIGDVGGSNQLPGQKANIAFVLDNSGSMTSNTIQFTNANGVTSSITRLEAMKQAVISAINGLYNSGASDIRIHIDAFATQVNSSGSFTLTTGGLDNNTQRLAAIAFVNAITVPSADATNYEAGLIAANNWIESTGPGAPIAAADVNKVIFVSDGEPNRAYNANGITTVDNVSSNVAMQHVLGTYNPSGPSNDDNVSEVNRIENVGSSAGQTFTIESVGIQVGANALTLLGQVEGTGGSATNVNNANQLNTVIGQLTGGGVQLLR